MGSSLDSVPSSGIIRIRDLMFSVERPFRLDQGDVSFDAPETFKAAMKAAIDANQSHYLQTTGLPRLLDLLADKLRRVNGIPVESGDEVLTTNGGVHALYLASQALVEPGDEVIIPDPVWPQMLTRARHGRRDARARAAARAAGLALRPGRASGGDHAAHAGPLPQLARQPRRRPVHARATSNASPRSSSRTTCG